jgi:PhoPQ-activated pathogenicity-related protein
MHTRFLTALVLCVAYAAGGLRADLESYVKAPDASFAFTVNDTADMPGVGTVTTIRLVSQTWHGIRWEHWLRVIRPEKVTQGESALLVISGGSQRKEPPKLGGEAVMLSSIAAKTGSVVAVLSQVPNQPLFDNLREDALISYTFQKYMETKDDTWPCLLPMVKSAVRAMDVVQRVVKEKHGQDIARFVVTGASKRGWTTWLTAVVDARVSAIAPMVIDTLNFPAQMELQVKSFGRYSEEIADYSDKGLPDRMRDPAAVALLKLIDPYLHRAKLTMPKLVVLGTNDRYWPVDAVKLYFGDLPGEKLIHYVPNAGHGLGPGAVEAITAFYQAVTTGASRPSFTWNLARDAAQACIAVACKDRPEKAELWTAEAKTRDFRDAKWAGAPLAESGAVKYEGRLALPKEGFAAMFVRLTFKSALGELYTLATNVEVLGDPPEKK